MARSWAKYCHQGECDKQERACPVGDVMKAFENRCENGSAELASRCRLTGLKYLKCRGRDDGAKHDHPA